jgi:hypothetical protein
MLAANVEVVEWVARCTMAWGVFVYTVQSEKGRVNPSRLLALRRFRHGPAPTSLEDFDEYPSSARDSEHHADYRRSWIEKQGSCALPRSCIMTPLCLQSGSASDVKFDRNLGAQQ